MKMRVAVIGSRDYQHLDVVKMYVNDLAEGVIVVSGGARGVDTAAHEAAKARGLTSKIYLADWSKGKGAGFARNSEIVKNSDLVVAFWDGTSKGTLDTVMKAKVAGVPVIVFGPDGLPA